MRLLQVNTLVNSGSTGRIAEDIGQVMKAQGHESYIAYGRGNRPSQSKQIQVGHQLDILWHGLQSALFDRHGFGSRRATQELVKKIKALQPDIIGMHNIHGYYLNIEVLFRFFQEVEIPVVWTLHDCWAFTGHCAFYTSIKCQRWQTACYDCPKKNKYPRSYWLDQSRRNFEEKRALFTAASNLQLVTPSKWLADQLKQSYLNEIPVQVIHNGVDTSAFHPDIKDDYVKKLGLSDKSIILGVASTWDERKGLAEFVKLADMLSEDYQIVLVGLSPNQIKKLPTSIYGLERTESLKELCALYAHASVYCNPTFQDNFPNTNIEALACGTPVVAYKTGGCPEAVDEQTGRIVEVGDVSGVLSAIKELCEMDRDQLRKACRGRALKHFDKNDRYLDYLTLYEAKIQADA